MGLLDEGFRIPYSRRPSAVFLPAGSFGLGVLIQPAESRVF